MIHDLAYFVAGVVSGVVAAAALAYGWFLTNVVGARAEP